MGTRCRKHLTLLLAAGCLIAAACTSGSGGNGGGDASARGACVIDSDCEGLQVCGFAESAACGAKGECFPVPEAICKAYSPGCACDGTTINVTCTGRPQGYVSKPLAYAGECGMDAGKAGNCCPSAWDMYSCAYPDGGAGLACHNPAMGCPSSMTCGVGCDAVVTGRCDGG